MKIFIFIISIIILISNGSFSYSFEKINKTKINADDNEVIINEASLLNKESAMEKANAYMEQYYSDDEHLENISSPNQIFKMNGFWHFYYKDKTLSRMPSGVEITVNAGTGEVERFNQE